MKLAVGDTLYTSDAQPVCPACNANADHVATDKRAAGNIVKAGWTSIGGSLAGVVAQISLMGIIAWFFVAAAIVAGAYVLRSADSRNERFTKHLTTSQRTIARVCAIAGIAIGVLTIFGVPFRMFYTLRL